MWNPGSPFHFSLLLIFCLSPDMTHSECMSLIAHGQLQDQTFYHLNPTATYLINNIYRLQIY